mmetsp:Transcript_21333/g.24339  ORF Transcript_21333/g.24339 Transcript_21333/m.24339 type:complete len:108 (-) Transcript_21333:99-422(-)
MLSLVLLRNYFIPPSSLQYQVRYFSKRLSKQARKRIPLSPKRAGKGYYKGNRCTKEGYITSKARFIVDWSKRLELIVPKDLDTFKLKPYIASTASKMAPEQRKSPVG